jgi:hypothetical protein
MSSKFHHLNEYSMSFTAHSKILRSLYFLGLQQYPIKSVLCSYSINNFIYSIFKNHIIWIINHLRNTEKSISYF